MDGDTSPQGQGESQDSEHPQPQNTSPAMDGDTSPHGHDGIDNSEHFNNATFFADFGETMSEIDKMSEHPFMPDGMSEIFEGSSVSGSQARAPGSVFGRSTVEPQQPVEADVAREGAEARAEAHEAPAENQVEVQMTEPEPDLAPSVEQGAAAAVDSVARLDITATGETPQAGENGEEDKVGVEQDQPEPQTPQIGGNDEQLHSPAQQEEAPPHRSASQSSSAMMPPPRPRSGSHASAVTPEGSEGEGSTEIISPRALNFGNSMLSKKKEKAPRPSPALSARERLAARQAANRARHQENPEDVRQSIEPVDGSQDVAMQDASDTEITDSRAFHRYEARSFAMERPVLRYKLKAGTLSADERSAWQAMEKKQDDRQGLITPRHEQTPSEERDLSPAQKGVDETAKAFREVKALYERRTKAGIVSVDEDIEFMKMQSGEEKRLRKQHADAIYNRSPSAPPPGPRNESPSLFVSDTHSVRTPREPVQSSRRSKFQQPAAKRPRNPVRVGSERPQSRAPSEAPTASDQSSSGQSMRSGTPFNPRKRSAREASISLETDGRTGNFVWKTPNNTATGHFHRKDKHSKKRFSDDEMNALLQRAGRQKDDAEGRRDQLHFSDGFDEEIDFGNFFLEACKKEDRNGVPEAYLENCTELMANIIKNERKMPQYKGVLLKDRLHKYRNLWKSPRKKDPETGHLKLVKDGVDKEFDKRRGFVLEKLRTSQLTVEHACRFAIECDIQRCRLQRRHLQNAGRSRTQAFPSNDDDGPARFRLPTSQQFKTAWKPSMETMIEEASQMLAEALFHAGAASHRLLGSFSQKKKKAAATPGPTFAPIGDSPIGGYDNFGSGDDDAIESENGDLFE